MNVQSAATQVHATSGARQDEILSKDALTFLSGLHRKFDDRRLELLARRMERQKLFDAGQLPHFLTETKSVREGDWKVAPIPADLLDRRVEITGPVDRKMIVNALNSGAKVFMADFEDATSPLVEKSSSKGNSNLKRCNLVWDDRHSAIPTPARQYKPSSDKTATLLVRPRGWHLPEKPRHSWMASRNVRVSLFDFGLYVFPQRQAAVVEARAAARIFICRRWRAISKRGSGTTFLISPQARARSIPRMARSSATVLIETILGYVRDRGDSLRTARTYRRG